jgi:hypothetical protein
VTVVVISSSEKGDGLVESLDVKASVAERNLGQIRLERRATGQAVAKCEPGNLENEPCLKRMAGYPGEPSLSDLGEGHSRNR